MPLPSIILTCLTQMSYFCRVLKTWPMTSRKSFSTTSIQILLIWLQKIFLPISGEITPNTHTFPVFTSPGYWIPTPPLNQLRPVFPQHRKPLHLPQTYMFVTSNCLLLTVLPPWFPTTTHTTGYYVALSYYNTILYPSTIINILDKIVSVETT